MRKYSMQFVGRTRGAIGIFHVVQLELEAESPEALRAKVLEEWEPYLSIDQPMTVHLSPVTRLEGNHAVRTGEIHIEPVDSMMSKPFVHGLIVEVAA